MAKMLRDVLKLRSARCTRLELSATASPAFFTSLNNHHPCRNGLRPAIGAHTGEMTRRDLCSRRTQRVRVASNAFKSAALVRFHLSVYSCYIHEFALVWKLRHCVTSEEGFCFNSEQLLWRCERRLPNNSKRTRSSNPSRV